MLLPEAVSDPGRRQRFIQEVRTASALDHPAIVVQYIDGKPLRELLPVSPAALSGWRLGPVIAIVDWRRSRSPL